MRVKIITFILSALTAVPATFVIAEPAFAANYPLQILIPRTAGTAPDAGRPTISPNHRIFKAYPGIQYNIRAAIIGGTYPFTFSLSNAPAGMTINSSTGEISWPTPTDGTTVTPTITVVDSDALPTQLSASWTITVTTSGFRFLDAVNGQSVANGGTGTRANPWRTIRDMYEGNDYDSKRANSYANQFLYFMNGTYYLDAYIEDGAIGSPGRMAVLGGIKPVVWMAYPGHTPRLDYSQGTIPGSHVHFYSSADNVYVDGLTVVGTSPMAYHSLRTDATGNYQVMRRNNLSVIRSTERSLNQSCIMLSSGQDGSFGSYMVIQDNTCHDVDKGAGFKIYSTYKMLIEDNTLYNIRDTAGDGDIEGIALKYGTDRATVRHNVVYDVSQKGIGGNMNSGNNFTRDVEILFNRIYNASNNAVEINQNGVAGPIYIYRNTFVGRISVRNTDSADGPFYFSNNVIVNSASGIPDGSHIDHDNVSAPSRIVLSNNLVGYPTDNILGPNLTLTSAYSSYVGTRGFELGGPRPPAPQNLRVQ